MLANKTPKAVPAFVGRLIEFFAWLSTPPPVLLEDDHADWYTGLCVDPRGFSEQLGKLQTSLRALESATTMAAPRVSVTRVFSPLS
jgi:hypothetical protein